MDSIRSSWSLGPGILRSYRALGQSSSSLNSVSGDSGIGSEYTHVSIGNIRYPSLWVKIKYPSEADDAARSGMLTSCDFDEVLEKLQEAFQNWEIFLDAKRMTNYCRHVLPKTLSSDLPRHRIIVKVRFTAWRSNIDVHSIRQIVEDVLNKTGDFYVELQCHKIKEQN